MIIRLSMVFAALLAIDCVRCMRREKRLILRQKGVCPDVGNPQNPGTGSNIGLCS